MEVGRPCGNEETYMLERGRKRDAQVRKRHTVEMLRNKYKLDGGQEAALSRAYSGPGRLHFIVGGL